MLFKLDALLVTFLNKIYCICTSARYVTNALTDFPKMDIDNILNISLVIGENVVIFIIAAVALDYCLKENLLSLFPLEKQCMSPSAQLSYDI